ncbi:MAG: hypothetical protein ACFCVD_19460 [Nodosilinea sp.]
MAQSTSLINRPTPLEPARRFEGDFNQWAKAVRQQMVDALKRRGNG